MRKSSLWKLENVIKYNTKQKNTLAFVMNGFVEVVNGNASVGYRNSCIKIAPGHNCKY